MKKYINLIFAVSVFPAFATDCALPSEAIQKFEISKAVEKTEKESVKSVSITGPGLAVISFGEKGKKVVMTFAFHCPSFSDAEAVKKNPMGFQIITYTTKAK